RHEQRSVNPERPLLAPEDAFVNRGTIRDSLQQQTAIVCRPHDSGPDSGFACDALSPLTGNNDAATGQSLRAFFDDFDGRILVTGASAGRREAMRDWLTTLGMAPARCESWAEFLQYDKAITVTSARLEAGAILPD